MDGIQSFFRKHHAVPANDAGPQYDLAKDEPLVAHADALVKAWDDHFDETRGIILPELKDARGELFARAVNYPFPSEPRRKLTAAWYALCQRIGFGG